LGPRLLGFESLPKLLNIAMPEGRRRPIGMPSRQLLMFMAAGLIMLLTLFLEYGAGIASMALVRAAAVTVVLMVTIRPWRRPIVRTTLAWSVWTAVWMITAGVWISAVFPPYRVDFLHIIFMGGFTLLILSVGTRVTLSHGGYALSLEKRLWPLRIGVFTVIVAMLARVGAPFATMSYFEHVAFAGILWIAGMILWGLYIARLIRGTPR
ncbi:MAG: NnrS family protein, partial [Acidobacteria bacterium]|nr:NnrS family protein [Acidobacteriota bacterium]